MKKQNRILLTVLGLYFMVFTIIPSFLLISPTVQASTTSDRTGFQELKPKTSQFIPRTIRVAFYGELNVTRPSYDTTSSILNSNYTALWNVLENAGYQVYNLTKADVLSHKLKTADYDVFIMADNLPRESIVNYVKEFWLGGGGILSLDSAIVYLNYAGILPPESEGGDGEGIYWNYISTYEQNITMRHPITKSYQLNDTYLTDFNAGWASYDWTALQGTSIASDLVMLGSKSGSSNDATSVAFDPSNGGGRVVQLPFSGKIIHSNTENLAIDAIEWLCPRPKGRILFDLSHQPFYGVDDWDEPDYATWGERYYLWRDNLVNRSYTFDKLYPSATGNLTSNNLAPYDMLILGSPTINYTANEISSVMNWVNNGGGLFILGGYYDANSQRINDLLSSTGLNVNLTNDGAIGMADYKEEHPTVEGCTQLELTVLPGLINHTGNAFPIWGQSSKAIVIGGQEYGNGRIILSGDMFFLRFNNIILEDNLQFSINVANWLTASQAEVLIYVHEHISSDPNDNPYRGPVAAALNDLGVRFYLTFEAEYFKSSLTNYSYSLVVIDNTLDNIMSWVSDDLIDFLNAGGYLIVNTWEYRSGYNELWDYLGFSYAGNYFTTPPGIYLWDDSHKIFTEPALFSAPTLNTSLNFANTDYSNVTLHSNATAIAGLTPTAQNSGGAIILGVGGHAIVNTFHLTEYFDDTDDSTYPDALEIWENEIAYMLYQSLSVQINSPLTSDAFSTGAPSYNISTDGIFLDNTWYTLNDGTEYHVASTTGAINQAAWEALPEGTVSLKFYVEDGIGQEKYQEVTILKDSQDPTISIVNPIDDQSFASTAPSFIVEILDTNLDQMWYTLGSNTTKHFFTANGSIVQSAWDLLAPGNIPIKFYANDTLGNETSA